MCIRCDNTQMVWVIHRRCSLFAYAPELRSIGDVMAMLSPAFSSFHLQPVIRQQNQSDCFFIHDLIRKSQCMLFHVKSLDLLYDLHKPLYHRHDIVNTSPHHRQDITITPPTHPLYSCAARRRITNYRRFSKYIVNC